MTGPHPVRQPERFIMPYRAAVASRPDDAGAHFELGLMAWYVGRLLYIGPRGLSARRPWWREAVRALERAIAFDPDLARALALLGLILYLLVAGEEMAGPRRTPARPRLS